MNTDDLKGILNKIVNQQHTEEDITLLKQALVGNNSQIASYIVNIGEGKDIHTGDRIYQGADAEAVRQIVRSILEELKISGQFLPSLEISSPSSQQNQQSVDELVQQVRSRIHDDIH